MAAKIRMEYSALDVHIEGDLDRRGRKGVSAKVPVHFADVRVRIRITTNADERQLARLIDLVARYCPVDSLMRAAVPTYSVAWEAVAHHE